MSNTKRDNGVEWRRSSCCLFLNQALYFWDMTQTCDIQSVLLAWTACSAQLRSIYCISPCDMLMFLWAGSTRECSRSPFAVQLEPPKQKTARTSQPSGDECDTTGVIKYSFISVVCQGRNTDCTARLVKRTMLSPCFCFNRQFYFNILNIQTKYTYPQPLYCYVLVYVSVFTVKPSKFFF